MESHVRPSGPAVLLSPRSVAVIGASADPTRIGGRPIAYMLSQGFAGRILPVNPNRSEVQGLRAYAAIAELPEVPDVAVVAVAAAQAVLAVRELARAGVGAAIVLSAGFAETGAAGAAAQRAMLADAAAHGMRLLGPNCLGLFDARSGFYPTFSASFESGWPLPGRIGIASQSGAFGTHLYSVARDRGIGTPVCVTTGNEADITVGEVIGWLAGDPGIDVIAAYAEGISRPELFLAGLAAARAARKPVVMMKVGRSALGRSAARSHTAAIAGDDAVIGAVLAEFGVQRARSTEELLDIAHLATRRIYPVAGTLGVLTISGGAGVMISDAAEQHGLDMPPMPDDAQAALRALVPFAAPANPVDCTAQAFNDLALVGQFADAMAGQGGYAAVLAFFSQVGGAPSIAPRLRAELAATLRRHPDRLWVLSVLAPPSVVGEYEADGFTVFEDPSRAVAAIAAMHRLGASFAASPPVPPPVVPVIALPASTPDEATAKRLLAGAGIAMVPERACATAGDAVAAAEALGFPVVMKILSPDILHKTEIGGVLPGVTTTGQVRDGFALLTGRARSAAPRARLHGVLVARQMQGVECLMGVVRDPVFGPVAAFGLGGVYAEVLRDVAFHRCPFGDDVAETMIRSLRASSILLGARGLPPVDIGALARMLALLSVFAHQAGETVRSVELNPVFARPDGAFAADAVLEIGGG